jgi:hypothetical protein
MVLASLVMALAAWGASTLVESNLGHHGLVNQLAAGLLPVVAGIAAYGLGAVALRIPEAAALRDALARVRRPTGR